MLTSSRIPLGAPGIYPLPDYAEPRLHPQRMDVCAFVGVAPRGPAHVPLADQSNPDGYRMITDVDRPRLRSVAVAVKSFDEYRRLYGAFEGPGLLPYAVASFFEQGGRCAYIVRVVPREPDATFADPRPYLHGLAQRHVGGVCSTDPLRFLARNAGTWGDALDIEMGFATAALNFAAGAGNSILVDRASAAPVGTLLVFTDANGAREFAYCRGVAQVHDPMQPVTQWQLQFDLPLGVTAARADIVEAWLTVRDDAGNSEAFDRLGLHPDHPHSLASVLCDESSLLWPHYEWAGSELLPASTAVELLHSASPRFDDSPDAQGKPYDVHGDDKYEGLVPEDFFDPDWSPAEESAGSGIAALAWLPEVTHLVVPDLYQPAQWLGEDTDHDTQGGQAGAEFSRCVDSTTTITASATPPTALVGLILDPRRNDELTRIAELQNRIVAFCEDTQNLIALIDVPPGLSQGQAERWRGKFDSSWCAAYHPWLAPSRRAFDAHDERTQAPRRIAPSAVAAGLVARKEIRFGIQFGPANEIAAEIVDLGEPIPPGRADTFHPQGLNCFTRECDGIHLVSARTLARDPQWRQLSVRRLILMLRRTLLRETQWAVFEPNGPKLWRDLRHAIENLLRRLYLAGAFVGATEAEAFFVRIRNDTATLDRGQLLIEIGVAPAEPIEYIRLQLRRDGDGTLILEE